jgi:apolipoprotein N-acyltransferase
MSRRASANPAQARARAARVDQPEPPPTLARRLRLNRRLPVVVLHLLAGALLTLALPPYDIWPLAFVAMVPWLAALTAPVSRRWDLAAAAIGGLAFWAGNLYWLTWITLVGYIPLVGVLVALWWMAAVVVRAALMRRWPAWVVFPVVWVALEYLRAWLLSGFPWFFLAHSQYSIAPLIQIADITGQYGVSLLVALINAAIFDLVVRPALARPEAKRQSRKASVAGGLVAAAMLAATLGYGFFRLGQQSQKPGPVIGIVQHSYPVALNRRSAPEHEVFEAHIASSGALAGKCDLVVWPETMLPTGLNRGIVELDVDQLSDQQVRAMMLQLAGPAAAEAAVDRQKRQLDIWLHWRRLYSRQMAEVAGDLGCPILAGGTTVHPNPLPLNDDDGYVSRNSAMVYGDQGPRPEVYSKVHCVPFSEYVPFKYSWLGLHRFLRWFVPDVMRQLDPGRQFLTFDLPDRQGRSWRLATPICYEGTFARVVREMVVEDGRKQADVVVNLSNDGWFVYQGGRAPYSGSNEHTQHLAHYAFRAVENRVPVVRAVNTGISASIDSNGRIVSVLADPLDGRRTMISGALWLGGTSNGPDKGYQPGPRVLVDDRTSVYSLIGDVFAQAIAALAVGMTAVLVVLRRQDRKKETRNR